MGIEELRSELESSGRQKSGVVRVAPDPSTQGIIMLIEAQEHDSPSVCMVLDRCSALNAVQSILEALSATGKSGNTEDKSDGK